MGRKLLLRAHIDVKVAQRFIHIIVPIKGEMMLSLLDKLWSWAVAVDHDFLRSWVVAAIEDSLRID